MAEIGRNCHTRVLSCYTNSSSLSIMDSLDAQCLIFGIAGADGCAPPQWVHPRDGSLGYHFPGGRNVSSWPTADVAEMARRWRSEEGSPLPPVARMVEAHATFVALVESSELEQPDLILHDLETEELRAIWDEPRLEVIVDLDDPDEAVGSLRA